MSIMFVFMLHSIHFTLVFDNELHEVEELINQIWDCEVDAVIVQDVVLQRLFNQLLIIVKVCCYRQTQVQQVA